MKQGAPPLSVLCSAQQIAAQGEPRVTVSIGVAEVQLTGEVPEQLIRRADAALYQARATGRNRVVVHASHAKG